MLALSPPPCSPAHPSRTPLTSPPLSPPPADPPSVPADPGAPPDPRTPSKIIDGACVTCDEMHSWVAPFDPARPNRVRLDFESEAALGMARVWNYNASRVHSTRGARLVELAAVGGDQGDEERRLLFRGVVGQAPGNLGQAPACAECIVVSCACMV